MVRVVSRKYGLYMLLIEMCRKTSYQTDLCLRKTLGFLQCFYGAGKGG